MLRVWISVIQNVLIENCDCGIRNERNPRRNDLVDGNVSKDNCNV